MDGWSRLGSGVLHLTAPATCPLRILLVVARRVYGPDHSPSLRNGDLTIPLGNRRGEYQEFRVWAAIVDTMEVPNGPTQSPSHP